MKKILAVIFISAVLFSGCSYSTDVENQAFVVAIGIDKGDSFPLKTTFIFANPSGGSSGGGGGGGGGEEQSSSTPKPDSVTVEAPTVYSAVRKLDSIKSKTINLSHIKIVVFSDEIAKEGVKDYLRAFASSRDFRPNTYVCIAKGDAGEYLKEVKPAQEIFIEKYYDNIMHKVAADKVNEAYLYYLYFNVSENFSGSLVPLAALNKSKDSPPSPDAHPEGDDFEYESRAGEIMRDAKNPAEMLGSAIMRNDKMVGTLGSFKTDLARIICDEYYPRNYSIKYPEKNDFLTIRLIQQERTQIKTKLVNGNAEIVIYVPISIEYVDAGKIENNIEESKKFCDFLEKKLNEKSKELIYDSQFVYGADILGLGNSMKRHFTDMKEWKKWNWKDKYSSAQIKVVFDVEYADFEEAN